MLAGLACGICGCLCYGIGDWLMIFGETSHLGKLFWLTEGVANIPAWRNNAAMILAFPACEALFQHLSWVVAASEIMMLPVFIYWFFAVVSGKTFLPKKAAFFNVLVFYVILKALTFLMANTVFRIGFTNALMSESMVLFFVVTWLFSRKIENSQKENFSEKH